MDFIEEDERKRRLPVMSFSVDQRLTVKDISPFPNKHSFIVFAGAPGSGKTTLALGVLTSLQFYGRVFDRVYPIIPEESVNSMRDNPFSDLEKGRVKNELNEEILTDLHEELKQNAAKSLNSVLIIDDFASDLKRKDVQRLLRMLVLNRRHLRLTLMILTQGYILIPLDLRKVINTLVLFKPMTKKESNLIAEELSLPLSRSEWDKLLRFVFRDPHDITVINPGETVEKMFSRNLNPVKLVRDV
jgi:energy-coupling factor transporter ATP-binding protein EcfA2